MKKQSYANHGYFPTMTPVAGLPAVIALLLFSFEGFRHPSLQVFGLIAIAFSAMVLALISRAYTVRLQDRIIRLEMRLRLERLGFYALFGPCWTQVGPKFDHVRRGETSIWRLPCQGPVQRVIANSFIDGRLKIVARTAVTDCHSTALAATFGVAATLRNQRLQSRLAVGRNPIYGKARNPEGMAISFSSLFL
jgi:hypothetical protein